MRSRKLLLIGASVAVLSLGLAACGDDDDDGGGGGGGDASFDLFVGALIPQTGDLAPFAPAGAKAFNLAIDEANAALEEAGADITVEGSIEDTQTQPQAAQQAARKAISDGASCLAGAWASGSTIPVGQSVARRQQVPLISPASTSPEITDLPDDGFVFRVAPSDALQGQVLADYVEEELGGADGTISLAARNDAYGEGIINQFQTSWEEKGGTVTGPVLYDLEQSSYNSEADDIVAGGPDAFVIIDFEEPYNRVGAALARTGNFDATNMFTADGLAFDPIPGSIPTQSIDGARGTRPATPEGTDVGAAFDDLYKGAGGTKERGTFDAQNFDATLLCVLAAVAAGEADGAAIAEQIPEVAGGAGDTFDFTDLAGAIEALQNGDEINYEGVTGPVDLDDNGDPVIATYERWSYKDGKLTVSDQVEQEATE